MSAAALVDEYGLDGLYGVRSLNRLGSSNSRSPYTSSVEMWWNRTLWWRTASSKVNVPITFDRRNGAGLASELSLWVSAAKWTTASDSDTSRDTSAASVMSPSTKRTASASGSSDSRLPAYVRASSTVTESSGYPRTVLWTKLAPMNPAPPVTNNRMSNTLTGGDPGRRSSSPACPDSIPQVRLPLRLCGQQSEVGWLTGW